MRMLPGGAAATDGATNLARAERRTDAPPRPGAKPAAMRRDLREAVTLFWRSLALDLLQGGENAVLMLSATGNEGEAEVAHLTARLAIQEGFRSVLVRTRSRVPAGNGHAEPESHSNSARLRVQGSEFKIEPGGEFEPDVLDIELTSSVLRAFIRTSGGEHQDQDFGSVLLEQLTSRYDAIFVVSGSVLSDPYSLLLARHVRGVVLAVRAQATRLSDLAKAKALIEEAGGEVLGTVLTNRRYYVPGWIYRRL